MPAHTVSLRAPILLINYCDVPHNNDHMQDEEVTWRELFIDNNATTYTHINVHFHLLYKLIQSLTTDIRLHEQGISAVKYCRKN